MLPVMKSHRDCHAVPVELILHVRSQEPAKKWRDEIRDEKEKKLQIKQKSERKVAPQTVEEPEFVSICLNDGCLPTGQYPRLFVLTPGVISFQNPTSKNKYADLDVSENQDESED